MKNLFFIISFVLSATFALTSCSNSDDNTSTDGDGGKKYNLTVALTYPADVAAEDVADLKITATNSAKELTFTEDAKGKTEVIFKDLPSGQYAISVSGKVNVAVRLSGAGNVDLYKEVRHTVTLASVEKSPLIFKEIYYTSFLYYFNDTYFEIVNNSDEVQYLDQCILGYMIVLSKPNPWVDDQGKQLDRYPCYGPVIAFPGNGTDYPIQPGKSIVIANDAANHSTLKNPACPNLTTADWEVYITTPGTMGADVDYDVPNMNMIYACEPQRTFGRGVFGMGIVMAKLPQGTTPEAFVADAANRMIEPNKQGATQEYLMIPSKYVLDAVEVFDMTESEHYHTLLAKDDAGYTFATAWGGKSVRRKVTEVKSGRAYYKDTNNSTDDFLTDQPLTPGVHPTSAD